MTKCCRSNPRCKRCPVVLAQDRRAVLQLVGRADVPAHLEGVPECLHRFEPLLRRAWEERQADKVAA
jgi:hypothetical protein